MAVCFTQGSHFFSFKTLDTFSFPHTVSPAFYLLFYNGGCERETGTLAGMNAETRDVWYSWLDAHPVWWHHVYGTVTQCWSPRLPVSLSPRLPVSPSPRGVQVCHCHFHLRSGMTMCSQVMFQCSSRSDWERAQPHRRTNSWRLNNLAVAEHVYL